VPDVLTVDGLPAVVASPGAAGVPSVAFVHDVAGVLAVCGALAAVCNPAVPGTHILAGVFLY